MSATDTDLPEGVRREWTERANGFVIRYAELDDGTVWRRYWPTGMWQEVPR